MDTLNSGKTLSVGDSLQSANKQYTLTLRTDGNLVLLGPPIETKLGTIEVPVLWSSGTNFPAPETPVLVTMQADGNLVLTDSSGTGRWTSRTAHNPGASLVVRNDRNVVIYNSSQVPIWSTQTSLIEHIFVLMLENRSYDHMLGDFREEGIDAETGGKRVPDGYGWGGHSNSFGGLTFPARLGAPQRMPHDVGHGFDDVLTQLCYDPISDRDPVKANKAWNYPPITNGGFVKDWEDYTRPDLGGIIGSIISGDPGGPKLPLDPTIVMSGFGPADLPVLYTLASEFAVCDRWFSSLPGPTEPNRRFLHAASSAGLYDGLDGPTTAELHLFGGVTFKNGTIFDKLTAARKEYRIFQGDTFPQVQSLANIDDSKVFDFGWYFQAMVQNPSGYTPAYTFIEPNYGNFGSDFTCGDSQHPVNDITNGEWLIKFVYETIRNSPIWNSSLLIITYDEHGGFYDHVPPPPATPPGDTSPDSSPGGVIGAVLGGPQLFAFDLYGVRVPAVVISPYIPKGTIDDRTYDHTSVLRTIEDTFMLGRLTQRDTHANSLLPLLLLGEPRGTPSVSATSPSPGHEPPTVVPIDPRASAPPVTLPSPAVSVNPEDCSDWTSGEFYAFLEDAAEKALVILAFAIIFGLVPGWQPPQQVGQIIAQNADRFAPIVSPQQVQEIAARIARLPSWPPELPARVMKVAQQLVTPVDITLGTFLYVAMRREFALGGVTWDEVLDKAKRIETNWEARSYMDKVAAQLRSKRNEPGGTTL